MRRGVFIMFVFLMTLALYSCRHKDLCLDHNHNPNLKLEVKWELKWNLKYLIDWDTQWNPEWKFDWNKVIPPEPEGVRLVAVSHDDRQYVYNLPSGGGTISLPDGEYTTLLYNNDTEYIVFGEQDSVEAITATTRSRSRSPYSENNPTERTVNQPDYLFSSYSERFLIDSTEFEENEEGERVVVLNVPMEPVVFSYIVRFEFDNGKEYINDARGALSGMAGTVHLSSRRTLDNVVTVLYEDAEVSDYGVEAVVRSFGLCNFDPIPTDEYPDGHFYTPYGQTRNVLTLELALKSGLTKTFEIDVTDRMNEQPRGGVLLVKGLEITPEEGEGTQTGGFEVEVGDWEDSEEVDLPL